MSNKTDPLYIQITDDNIVGSVRSLSAALLYSPDYYMSLQLIA